MAKANTCWSLETLAIQNTEMMDDRWRLVGLARKVHGSMTAQLNWRDCVGIADGIPASDLKVYCCIDVNVYRNSTGRASVAI
jgi:hypothetical protein